MTPKDKSPIVGLFLTLFISQFAAAQQSPELIQTLSRRGATFALGPRHSPSFSTPVENPRGNQEAKTNVSQDRLSEAQSFENQNGSTLSTSDDFIWEDETLPDWLEDLGYQEHNEQVGPQPNNQSQTIDNLPVGRQLLSGNWFGNRQAIQERGFIFRGSSTHFCFGVNGGINVPAPAGVPLGQGDTFKYTGRGEYDAIVNLDKFGGMPHGKLLIGVQHWYGEFGNVSLNSGMFAPAVFAATLPPATDDPGSFFITDFLWTQPLSEKLIVFAGKKNVVGTADQDIFAGGDGTDQFINQALVTNPAFLLGLPYSSFTFGAAMPSEWGGVSVFVYDPRDRTKDFFSLTDLFSDGVVVGGQVQRKTNFFNKQGEHHLGGLWKHVDQNDLQFKPVPPSYPNPPASQGLATKNNAYTIYYGFDQYIEVFPGEKGFAHKKRPRGWGFFGRASISDSNPTPLDYFFSAGIGGDSRAGFDRGDTWGMGWYHVGTSDKFGAIPTAALGPRDGYGVELFYNFRVKPWLYITPDIQFIRPGLGALTSGDDVFIYGLRMNIKL